MMFEHFKNQIKNMNIEQLNEELKKRKHLLMINNNPTCRKAMLDARTGKGKSSIPYSKVKREIAIINTKIHEIKNL